MGARVELRLGDPGESEAGRVKGALVPEGRPGRGVLKSGLHTLIGLPRLDGGSSVNDLAEGVRAAAAGAGGGEDPGRRLARYPPHPGRL